MRDKKKKKKKRKRRTRTTKSKDITYYIASKADSDDVYNHHIRLYKLAMKPELEDE